MKRIFVIPVIFTALFASCGKEQKAVQPSLMEASKQELAEALEERDQLLALVKEIAESMEKVKNIENIVSEGSKRNLDSENGYSTLITDISNVQKTLQLRRRQLSDMEKNLEETSLYSDNLKGVISALRRQIDSQSQTMSDLMEKLSDAENNVRQLNKEVDSLNNKVKEVYYEKQLAETASQRLADELNTCFFVIATKKELKKHNIIETAFLRKTKVLENEFDKSFFVSNDRRKLDSINLNSTNSKILTNHPKDSYEIIEKDRNQYLHIANPEKFWSLTNYLVIQID